MALTGVKISKLPGCTGQVRAAFQVAGQLRPERYPGASHRMMGDRASRQREQQVQKPRGRAIMPRPSLWSQESMGSMVEMRSKP